MSAATYRFASFDVTHQVFYKTALSFGIVNLKPLLPGHVLIVPRRVVPRLAELRHEEVSDLFLAVQQVGKVLESAYKASALTISLQDGAVAGQSVPHVHVHIMPRRTTDFDGVNDRVHPALEKAEQRLAEDFRDKSCETRSLDVPPDEERRPRSREEMEEEARWLSSLFGKEGQSS